jgi:hypothetical protein
LEWLIPQIMTQARGEFKKKRGQEGIPPHVSDWQKWFRL